MQVGPDKEFAQALAELLPDQDWDVLLSRNQVCTRIAAPLLLPRHSPARTPSPPPLEANDFRKLVLNLESYFWLRVRCAGGAYRRALPSLRGEGTKATASGDRLDHENVWFMVRVRCCRSLFSI